jgi:hypothetical protein
MQHVLPLVTFLALSLATTAHLGQILPVALLLIFPLCAADIGSEWRQTIWSSWS